MIDKQRLRDEFKKYTDDYDASNEKVKLKIVHTYRVAELCEQIAESENMSDEDCDLAYLIGMLHDIGRFEQLKRYNTFIDAESVDHATFGADLLFQEGLIRRFCEDFGEDELIEKSIRNHSAFRIEPGLSPRIQSFCHILRDADKIDIIRVNIDFRLEDIYNVTTEELMNAQVSEAVMQAFYQHSAVLRSLKSSCIDHLIGHISLTYELVYPKSLEIMVSQGYLDKMMNFKSQNPVTNEQMANIREEMGRYLSQK